LPCSLAARRRTPAGLGTLRTDTPTFVVFLVGFVIIFALLNFLAALFLGPLVVSLSQHLYWRTYDLHETFVSWTGSSCGLHAGGATLGCCHARIDSHARRMNTHRRRDDPRLNGTTAATRRRRESCHADRGCPPHAWDCPVLMKIDPRSVAWTCAKCGAIVTVPVGAPRPR
jgi:Potassium-transporting ATPase A subunit